MKATTGFLVATMTAVMMIASPAPWAAAQVPSINMARQPRALTAEEKQKRAEQEKAYKEQLSKIPDQKASNDPWRNVRSTETPSPPSAPKAKKNQHQTGSK